MKTITLTFPTIRLPFSAGLKSVQNLFSKVSMGLRIFVLSFADFANQSSFSHVSPRSRLLNVKRTFNNNKKKFIFLPVIIIGIVLVITVGAFLRDTTSGVMGASDTDQITLESPIAEKTLNKSFSFPVRDDKGKEVGKIVYVVEKATLRDEFIISGEKAEAIEGRSFLILSLRLKNDTKRTISIHTRDFVRMKLRGSEEFFAPTIHNDPVEVQAISTLLTQLGFPITDNDKSFVLQIGEIDGKKETFDLTF